MALDSDDFLVAQDIAPKDRHYVRVGAQGWLSRPVGATTWPSYGYEGDLALAPGGRFLMSSAGAAWWMGSDGPSLVMRASDKNEGIAGVAVLPSGEAIVADTGSRRIVRIGPDQSQTVVAGNGDSYRTGDGGSAVEAGIGPLGPVAAFSDGSFLLAQHETSDHVVRRVDAGGRIATLAGSGPNASGKDCLPGPVPATSLNFTDIIDLLALPGEDFLFSDLSAGVMHVSRAGLLTQILCLNSRRTERFYTNLDGRRASQVTFAFPRSLALTTDGTLLVAESGSDNGEPFVAMLAPAGSRRLGVAVASETHATITRRRLVVAATHPASVAIRVVHRRKTVVSMRAAVPAGRTTLSLRRAIPAGDVDVFVAASASGGRVAADRLRTVVPGRRGLLVSSVRRLILRYVDRRSVVSNPRLRDCRAISRAAVRCRLLDDPEEDYSRDEQWTIRRTRDGLLHASVRDTGSSGTPERYVIQP